MLQSVTCPDGQYINSYRNLSRLYVLAQHFDFLQDTDRYQRIVRVLPMFVPFVFFQASRVLVGDLQRAIATSNSALFMRSDAGLSSIR
jgi:hypothetical protein